MLWPNRFVDLGFDRYHVEKPEHEPLRMQVITNRIGNGGEQGSHAQTHTRPQLTNDVFLCALYSFRFQKNKKKNPNPSLKAEGKAQARCLCGPI